MLSDAELVRAAQRGDVAGLGILLERHRAPLYATALNILGYTPQAQDAVQDTFLVAMRKIGQLREPESVGGWLRAIVRNVCLSQLKRDQGEILFDDLATRSIKEPAETSGEEILDRLVLREWVWTALQELPEEMRVTAILRYFSTYAASYEEISSLLGVPVGTVRSRLNKAKARLARALLKTAQLEHDEARRLTVSRARFFNAALDEFNRKRDCEMLVDTFSEDLVEIFSSGNVRHGRAVLESELQGDLEDGIKVHLTNVLASKDVTVMEGDFENPPDNPFHCPPAISWVFFYRGVSIRQARRRFALRGEKGQLDQQWEANS
jgi:RNA polymerase sigma factor (sigma-70 family)